MKTFTYDELLDNLEGFHPYDSGRCDSGIRNDILKSQIIEYLDSLTEEDHRILLYRIVRKLYLAEEALIWLGRCFRYYKLA